MDNKSVDITDPGPPMTLSNVAQRGEGLGTTLPPEPDSEAPRRALLFEVNN
jgi:hypothetical protein